MKIIQISDLHFGAHNDTIKNHFLEDIASLEPDVIFLSGDLTQRAKTEQYQDLATFINHLPKPVLAVPGNHDIPLWNPLSRLLSPFKNYKRFIKPITQTTFQSDDIRILGANSVDPFRIKNGRLSDRTLQEIEAFFTDKQKLNLLFFHHNFDYLEGLHKPLVNFKAFMSYLKASPINIVCTGHLHYAHTSIIRKHDNCPCLVLHAGSLLSERTKDNVHSYYLLEIKEHQCIIHWRSYSKGGFKTETKYEIDLFKPWGELSSRDEDN